MSQPAGDGPPTAHVGVRGWLHRTFAVLGAPAAWFAHLSISYLIVPEACTAGTVAGMWVVSVVHLAVAVTAVVVSTRLWRGAASDRDRFLGVLGIGNGLLFVAVILVERIPVLAIDPCL